MRAAFAALIALLCAVSAAWSPVLAQPVRYGDENIAVRAFLDPDPARPNEATLALHFTPRSSEWHGYWSNPGDAGQGMTLSLDLPDGWTMGEPLYPVPQTLEIAGLMNHVYKGEYTVLVPLIRSAGLPELERVSGRIEYLACTDTICVPQDAVISSTVGGDFAAWRAAIAPPLDRVASYEVSGETLRIGLPLPASLDLAAPHLFVGNLDYSTGIRPAYADKQTFRRAGNLLIAEVSLREASQASLPPVISGILAFGSAGEGIRFKARPGPVPLEGAEPLAGAAATPPLAILLLAALAGGLILNIMPCVFPILSLKAMTLVKAGSSERAARSDALAYTAGVVLACAGMGVVILTLRAGGEQIGWAFQLQEPVVLAVLFLLACAITANFLGLFEIPGMAIAGGGGSRSGSFATGLLAAFVATPCTGPFMALALGAALVLSPLEGFAIFTMLGVGLALPFLAIGFVPALRRRLPRPGPWMATFRRWMALPMGLTALALGWLVWRIGGGVFSAVTLVLAVVVVMALIYTGRQQAGGKSTNFVWSALVPLVLVMMIFVLPKAVSDQASQSGSDLVGSEPFSETALAKARADGRPVFLYFTADWCLSCKVNESVAIEREATRDAFEQAGVVTLRGDWTRRDAEIADFLAQHGAAGVPFYMWFEPGERGEQLPQVLTPDLLAEKVKSSS
ncbi:thiol:disulfide interchange protein [Erythrobacter litoralis]|nr:thiol:disulfide interchange protein [Erythrobacter litoralis]